MDIKNIDFWFLELRKMESMGFIVNRTKKEHQSFFGHIYLQFDEPVRKKIPIWITTEGATIHFFEFLQEVKEMNFTRPDILLDFIINNFKNIRVNVKK